MYAIKTLKRITQAHTDEQAEIPLRTDCTIEQVRSCVWEEAEMTGLGKRKPVMNAEET